MAMNITKELAAMEQLCVGDLRKKYSELLLETTQAGIDRG